MKLVFVDNLLLDMSGQPESVSLNPHLGLLSLIAVAEGCGHSAVLYDPKLQLSRDELALDETLYRACATQILELSPNIVGFTSLGCNFICTLKIAEYINQFDPNVQIILGGPHATILHREILERFPVFDLVVRHEGEVPLQKLLLVLDSTGDLRDVPGISYRNQQQLLTDIVVNIDAPMVADLDQLPFPAFHAYPIETLGLKGIRVEAGRGCPFNCTFCSTAPFFGRSYRLKSPDRLLSELDFLANAYGITDFSLTHDLFTVSKKKVAAFCQAVEGRGYTWRCSARMDCVDESLLSKMSGSGCQSIYYGVEAGSARMQRIVQKRLDVSLVVPCIATTIDVGIAPTVSFITGYPQEEQADQDATLNMIGAVISEHRGNVQAQLHLLTPEPGTQLFAEFGDQVEYDGHISDFNFPPLESDDSTIMKASPDVFMIHHYFPTVIPRENHVFVTSAFNLLQCLGYTIFGRFIDEMGGSLACIMRELYEFSSMKRCAAEIDQATLTDFVRSSLGHSHYLCSLLRYVYGIRSLRDEFHQGHQCEDRGSNVYCFPQPVKLFRDIHNCQDLITMLEASPRDQKLTGVSTDLRSYLVLLKSESPLQVQNFRLSDEAAEIVDMSIAHGGLSKGVLDMAFEGDEAGKNRIHAFFQSLVDSGLAVASKAERA